MDNQVVSQPIFQCLGRSSMTLQWHVGFGLKRSIAVVAKRQMAGTLFYFARSQRQGLELRSRWSLIP
jgi:hypothetical protein